MSRPACLRRAATPASGSSPACPSSATSCGGFSPFRPEAFPSGVMFHLGKDATSRLVDWDVRLMGEQRDADLVVLTGVDVTHRIASQRRLRETEAFQRRVLDRLPAIVWTTDRELRTTFSAGGGLAVLGLASGEVALMGTPVSSYFQTDDPTHPGIAAHLRALEGESNVLEMDWFGRFFSVAHRAAQG